MHLYILETNSILYAWWDERLNGLLCHQANKSDLLGRCKVVRPKLSGQWYYYMGPQELTSFHITSHGFSFVYKRFKSWNVIVFQIENSGQNTPRENQKQISASSVPCPDTRFMFTMTMRMRQLWRSHNNNKTSMKIIKMTILEVWERWKWQFCEDNDNDNDIGRRWF